MNTTDVNQNTSALWVNPNIWWGEINWSQFWFITICISACLFQRLMGPDGMSMVNGTTGVHGEEYWTDGGTMSVSQVRPSSPQTQAQGPAQAQPQRQVSDVYSNTLPVRRPAPAKNKNPVGEISQRCWKFNEPQERCSEDALEQNIWLSLRLISIILAGSVCGTLWHHVKIII